MKRRTRGIRHRNNEPREQEEEEKSNNFLRGSMRTTSKRRREVGQERVRRWDYINPFSRSSFGLASEDWLREFNRMKDEMERVFEETTQDIERIPKELVREYQTTAGEMAREIGPLVYGYSYSVGADGKPQFREFGNVRPSQRSLGGRRSGFGAPPPPMLTADREPMADVTTTDKEVKVTIEMPGITKQEIKVSVYEGVVEVSTIEKAKRKYHRIIDLPSETDIETARSTYSNGILEIIFDKKTPPRGREIKVD